MRERCSSRPRGQKHARAAYSLAASLAADEPRDPVAAARWLEEARRLGLAAAEQTTARKALPLQFRPQTDLTDASARREALWLAATQGDLPVLAALADRPLVASADDFGRGALARAAAAGQADAVALLVKQGANVGAADHFGVTPVMLAAQAADARALDILLGAGAKADDHDAAGNTALMYAARAARPASVESLLKAGANATSRNAQDWSALDFALQANSPEIAATLRARGAVAIRRHAARFATGH